VESQVNLGFLNFEGVATPEKFRKWLRSPADSSPDVVHNR
jgi:hypothetical protein